MFSEAATTWWPSGREYSKPYHHRQRRVGMAPLPDRLSFGLALLALSVVCPPVAFGLRQTSADRLQGYTKITPVFLSLLCRIRTAMREMPRMRENGGESSAKQTFCVVRTLVERYRVVSRKEKIGSFYDYSPISTA